MNNSNDPIKDMLTVAEKARVAVVGDVFKKHLEALCRKRNMLVYRDDYGIEETKKWDAELNSFFKRVYLPEFQKCLGNKWGLFERFVDQKDFKRTIIEALGNAVEEVAHSVGLARQAPSDGYEYEAYCCAILNDAGWKARRTQSSADQGADVIAEQGILRVILQCKRYSSPVGNKAVQEVAAARSHYSGTHAVVVSNQSYTASAKTLAASTGVLLMHHDELKSLIVLLPKR